MVTIAFSYIMSDAGLNKQKGKVQKPFAGSANFSEESRGESIRAFKKKKMKIDNESQVHAINFKTKCPPPSPQPSHPRKKKSNFNNSCCLLYVCVLFDLLMT